MLLLLVPQVRAVFEQLWEPDWLVQDASQPIEQIHQQVRAFGGSLPAARADMHADLPA
jgi:hypothetical protein